LQLGLITTYWVSGIDSFIIGMAAFFCVEMVRVRFMAEHSAEVSSRIEAFLKLFQQTTPISELAFLFGFRYPLQLTSDSILCNRENAWEFWRQCMLRSKTKWQVISYSIPDDGWSMTWNDASLALQVERISNGCNIERIFIIENESELNYVESVMQRQVNIGVKVGYAFKTDILTSRVKD
jgi:hypothetical protein